MKSTIRAIIGLVLLFCAYQPAFSQLSDLHYLPPLKQKSSAFVEQTIYLSTPQTTPFTVNIYRGMTATPVASVSISKAAGATYNPGNGDNNITLLTDANTGSVQSNSGLRFESANGEKFYVNWRGKSANQASSLTSKGRAALGTAFKWVGAPNRGTSTTVLSNSLGIMATENNTTVNIFGYNPGCSFRLGAAAAGIVDDAITITLNKGQTFVLEAPVTAVGSANADGWLGASITSSNPIAVSFGQMHYQPSVINNQDCGIDQIIPENALGKEYIFVRGNGINDIEFPVIIATQNNTKIYVNGNATPIATINNGDYFEIPSTYYSASSTTTSMPGENMYVRTSKEAYAVQSLAGASSTATGDLNFIAPVNCLLASQVDNIPEVANIAGLTISSGISIIASSAIDDEDIVVNYGSNTVALNTLLDAKKTLSGTTEWKTYYLSGLTGNVTVSANGPIAVGYFGFSGVAGASGYFSGFETIPTIVVERSGDGCLPGTQLTATPGFTAYTWYRDGEVVPGITSHTYTPDMAGKFTVTVSNGSCSYHSANQYIYDCNPEIIVNTTANKSGIVSGEAVVFEVSVRYLGEVNVDNLVLTNLLPSNVTATGTSATYGTVTNDGSTYTWNVGTMRNGEEHLLHITATGNVVAVPTPGTLNVSKTQTFALGTEANKVADDFSETVTVFAALADEPESQASGLYFTNTGSSHPFNNVLHFTPSATADGYLVVRRVGTEPDFVPVDGTSYSPGQTGSNEIIYVGNQSSVTDLFAQAVTDYHYSIFAFRGGGAATNYLVENPVKAVINNRIGADFAMAFSGKSSSAGIATQGVNITFVNGLAGGTTITASRFDGSRPASFLQGLPTGLNSVKPLYFTVTSTVGNPGSYVLVLDFSALNLSAGEWQNARVLKRSGTGSNWEDISSNVISRKTDGLDGKLVIAGLSGFSDFAIGSEESTLPVSWLGFNARLVGETVALDWKTANEQNSRDFILQHSANGTDWNEIGRLAAAGNSNGPRDYSFNHLTPVRGVNYYRILQRDIDGNQSFSIVRTVRMGSQKGLTIWGNPVAGGVLRIHVPEPGMLVIRTIDGKHIGSVQAAGGNQDIPVHNLASGTYLLISEFGTQKFIKK